MQVRDQLAHAQDSLKNVQTAGNADSKAEQAFTEVEMLYIDPVECIDCGACVPVCPVSAIFTLDDLPEKLAEFAQKNADYYQKR